MEIIPPHHTVSAGFVDAINVGIWQGEAGYSRPANSLSQVRCIICRRWILSAAITFQKLNVPNPAFHRITRHDMRDSDTCAKFFDSDLQECWKYRISHIGTSDIAYPHFGSQPFSAGGWQFCIINRPDPGEHLGKNQGIQSILDLIFNRLWARRSLHDIHIYILIKYPHHYTIPIYDLMILTISGPLRRSLRLTLGIVIKRP